MFSSAYANLSILILQFYPQNITLDTTFALVVTILYGLSAHNQSHSAFFQRAEMPNNIKYTNIFK